jgi:hypothetical protein
MGGWLASLLFEMVQYFGDSLRYFALMLEILYLILPLLYCASLKLSQLFVNRTIEAIYVVQYFVVEVVLEWTGQYNGLVFPTGAELPVA